MKQSPLPLKTSLGGQGEGGEVPTLRMRIGSKDRRKVHMKGYVEIEETKLVGYTASFVVFGRDPVIHAALTPSKR